MEKNNVKHIYTVRTGAAYLSEKDTLTMYCSFSVKENINAALLRKTADAMMERCPYFHTKAELRDGEFFLVQSEDEIPVLEHKGYISVTEERSKGFLLTINYYEHTVYFCFHHALTDASGVIRFTRSFAAEYLRRVLKKDDIHVTKELCPGTPIEESEYEDPYTHVIHEEHPFSFHHGDGFSFPKEDLAEASHRIRLCIPTASILNLSKHTESNFSSVLAMLMSLAINQVYPVGETPILIKCPTDTRALLNCPDTLQNCHTGISYVYSERISRLPLDQQLSCFKGMMLLQTSREYLMSKLEKKKCKLEAAKAVHGKTSSDKQGKTSRIFVPFVTYMKNIDLEGLTPYLEDYSFDTPINAATGMLIVSFCIGSACVLSLRSNLKSKNTLKAFLGTLQGLSIPYRVIDKEGFGSDCCHETEWWNA